jgi:predicted NAD/FAD-binding protein
MKAPQHRETWLIMCLCCCAVCRFDAVVLATHSDISLSLLGAGATPEEQAVLVAIPYNNNDIYLHTDQALMPVSEAAAGHACVSV